MKNFQQDGDVITISAPYAVASGGGLLVGSVFGVAQTAASGGVKVEAALEGVFVLPKAAVAFTECQKCYWDDTAKNVTATVATNKLIGVAILPVSGTMDLSGTATGTFLLTSAFTV